VRFVVRSGLFALSFVIILIQNWQKRHTESGWKLWSFGIRLYGMAQHLRQRCSDHQHYVTFCVIFLKVLSISLKKLHILSCTGIFMQPEDPLFWLHNFFSVSTVTLFTSHNFLLRFRFSIIMPQKSRLCPKVCFAWIRNSSMCVKELVISVML